MTVGVETSQIHVDLVVVQQDRGCSDGQSWEARLSRHRVCQMHKHVVFIVCVGDWTTTFITAMNTDLLALLGGGFPSLLCLLFCLAVTAIGRPQEVALANQQVGEQFARTTGRFWASRCSGKAINDAVVYTRAFKRC